MNNKIAARKLYDDADLKDWAKRYNEFKQQLTIF